MSEVMQETLIQLHALLDWPENWNGYTAMKPDSQAITRAETWIQQFHECLTQAGLTWEAPMVTACPASGEVIFWWSRVRRKKVEISIGRDEECISTDLDVDDEGIEGIAIDEIFDGTPEGQALSLEQATQAWQWLMQ